MIMSRKLGFTGIFGVGVEVLATVLAVTAPANALNFTIFTDQPSWEAAVGGSFSSEDFNSFTVDTSFNNNSSIDVGDFTLNGTGNNSLFNKIDVPPQSFPINGTANVNPFVSGSSSLNLTFDSPITAFGATFNSASDFGAITQLTAGSDLVGNIPSTGNNSTTFLGFIADGSFTTLTVDSANGSFDAFSMDNFVYASSASVPFEFSPTLGLLAVGGVWGVSRLRKRLAPNQINQ